MTRLLWVWAILILMLSPAVVLAEPITHHNNVLVLIQPALAGPDVHPEAYWKPEWVLWPPTLDVSQGGRLCSVASGANWVGETAFLGSSNHAELSHRGFFDLRSKLLGPIRTDVLLNSKGGASSNALFLALNRDVAKVKPYWADEAWPTESLMVAEAASWDDVHLFEKATTGRVLVVEYPPQAEIPWTRYWMMGQGWPEGSPTIARSRPGLADVAVVPLSKGSIVPGLIQATQLIPLTMRPDEFRWASVGLANWPGANQLLSLNHTIGRWFCGFWMLLVALAVVWGTILVVNERTSRAMPMAFATVLISPAAVSFSGILHRNLGLTAWPVWCLVAFSALLASSGLLYLLQKKVLPKSHPLASLFFVGFLTMCLGNPVWGFLSPELGGRVWPVSPIAIAALFGYLLGFYACIYEYGSWSVWVGRAVCLIPLAVTFISNPWWKADLFATCIIPLAAILIAERRVGWRQLSLGIVVSAGLLPWSHFHFGWAPAGLIFRGQDYGAINAYEYVEFLLSPSFFVFVMFATGITIFGFRFFFRQMRNLRQLDLRRDALVYGTLAIAFAGVFHPIFFYSAMVLAVGAMSALLFDAVQTM